MTGHRSPPDQKSETAPTATPTGQSQPPAPQAGQVPATSDADVAQFIARLKTTATPAAGGRRGRLIFAMDATMSRQPTWDLALGLQSGMFAEVKTIGGLDVQLVYFRGFGECRASRWVADPAELAGLMTTVQCRGGQTQLGKVLMHARAEAEAGVVNAMVYVGDAMEEAVDDVCARAGALALLGVPVFLFQEGDNLPATVAFKEIARITRGAHCRFDAGSARQLRDLLAAVAVYAAGGRRALERLSQSRGGDGARQLLGQMK